MTIIDRPVRTVSPAHSEEWWSIVSALAAAAGIVLFLWREPDFEPASGLAWVIPGWIALAYIFMQMACLLVSATQIRALGVIDSAVSIVPVIAAVVTGVEWMLGHLTFSPFQLNVLATVLIASIGEFLLTIWARFILSRRTIAVEQGIVA